jgi:hypothetical protein
VTQLRDRVIDLQVDTLRIRGVGTPGLRVSFKACKTLKPEPNTCDITIYNLSPDHRAQLTRVKEPVVTLAAGYPNELTQVFYGQAIHVRHERKGGSIMTTVSTTDGGTKVQKGRAHVALGAGAKPGDVLRALAKSLNLKAGNLEATIRKLNTGKAASMYVEGVSISGHAMHEITTLCRSAGLEWSIQDGQLQFLDAGKAGTQFATVLGPRLLLGTPSVSSLNVVEGRTYLQKDFNPGRQVQIKSEFCNGAFRLEKCEYMGDTHGDEWAVNFEAKGPPPK